MHLKALNLIVRCPPTSLCQRFFKKYYSKDFYNDTCKEEQFKQVNHNVQNCGLDLCGKAKFASVIDEGRIETESLFFEEFRSSHPEYCVRHKCSYTPEEHI